MMKVSALLASLFLSQMSLAVPSHTGYCRYGEACDGIVSDDIYEAQKNCREEVFDTVAKPVYQEQKDGSVIFIGYVCVSPPN